MDDLLPESTPEPDYDWNAVRAERKRRGWRHFQSGWPHHVGEFAWIVMTQDHTDDPAWRIYPSGKVGTAEDRERCGHLLDFETARCTACGEPFPRPGWSEIGAYGIGIVVQFLEQGEALYHETCAPAGWNAPPQPPPAAPEAEQLSLF